jgi:hypothetical protein
MTAARLIPLPVRSALELMIGLALIVVPFALGLPPAALVAGVGAGALVAGLALQAADPDRLTVPVSALRAADHGLAIGLAGAAVLLGTVSQPAAVLFGAAAVALLVLTLTTRYVAR